MTKAATVLLALVLAGCAQQEFDRKAHFKLDPMPLGSQTDNGEQRSGPEPEPREPVIERLRAEPGPTMGAKDLNVGQVEAEPADLSGEPIQIAANNLPIPAFIDEVFGEKLGLSYSIAPGLSGRSDLVTMRLNEPLPPQALYRAARSVLADYGVGVTERDGVLQFSLAGDKADDEIPLLVTGEALPDVPISHRPVFQVIELQVVSNAQIRSVLSDLFSNTKVTVSENAMRNSLILRGPASQVENAMRAVRFFDRPVMKGRNSMVLRPAYREIPALTQALKDVLSSEGYAVGSASGSSGSVILLPMEAMDVIVALANDPDLLNHVQQWAERLDQDYQREIESGMFTYEVQNTSAANLANLISELYGSEYSGSGRDSRSTNDSARTSTSDDNETSSANNRMSNDGRTESRGGSTEVAGGRLVVDARRNILVYRGSGRGWMELKGIIEKLDKQVPSVLMEVLLAEVTLNDSSGTGVEWLLQRQEGDYQTTSETDFGIGEQGFSFSLLNSAGSTRAALNTFYDSNRAVIRSSPKIMVKSGEMARIEVGNEIPVITSRREGDTQTDGTSDVTQQFQFRQTGVELAVTPVVQASGLVDIQISQTLSETQDVGAGGDFLPTILNRTVETSLTLRDGGSVVLGGLISRTNSNGSQGVPLLARVPLLGRLFRADSDTAATTELLIMVVPYVIRNDDEAKRVSRELQRRIEQSEIERPEGPPSEIE